MTTREQIYSALFNLLNASTAFNGTSRKFKAFADVNMAEMPYMAMEQLHETYKTNGTGIPPTRIFALDIYIYTAVDLTATGATPTSQINTVLDAIETAMMPSANGRQTLGGIVYNAFIDSQISIHDGSTAGVAIAVIPITIRVTQ